MKTFYITLLFLTFIGGTLLSQEKKISHRKNYFKFAPAKLFANTLALGYERELKPKFTLSISSQLIHYSTKDSYQKGFVQDIAFQYNVIENFQKFARIDFYFMPYLQYGIFDFQNSSWDKSEIFKNRFEIFGGGIQFGGKLILSERIFLNAFFGGGLRINHLLEGKHYGMNTLNNLWDADGIIRKGGIEIGFLF